MLEGTRLFATVLCLLFLIPTSIRAQSAFDVVSPNDETGGSFGFQTRFVADMNGDNIGDVIVGAPDEDVDLDNDGTPEVNVGRVYVLSGSDQSVILTLVGDQAGARFGFSVDGGDFNDDGTDDEANWFARSGSLNHRASVRLAAGSRYRRPVRSQPEDTPLESTISVGAIVAEIPTMLNRLVAPGEWGGW